MDREPSRLTPSLTARPHRMRQAAVVASPLILLAYIWWGATLSGTVSNGGALTEEDKWALMGMGPIVALLALLPLRLRVDADSQAVRVRGFHRDLTLPWTAVTAVEFKRNRPWASLLVSNGESVHLLAIQVFDGPRAVTAIRELRALHHAAQTSASTGGQTS
ncbi:hypothetical protein GCM10022225_57370 [Plantactinospora mayteni]|uniref:Low molecular weight protein antigen 6 PH domain-containing protein n=1 Tax=Plantactinospora mayteni TaxID=566021 RepID=A0ABQ4F1S3_9ACTN|nr:PH domain-containing protein [Plantactinospora mayteni]GIH00859.1 hypothetical protein Pma05_74310 [Plantactinospora mayteni]